MGAQHSEIAGKLLRDRGLPELRITEYQYPIGLLIPKHTHESAYITLVLEGNYSESIADVSDTCSPGMVRFLPAGERHTNHFITETRCLHIAVASQMLQRIQEESGFELAGAIGGRDFSHLTRKLHREFLQPDEASALALEGLVLEILAEGMRSKKPFRTLPAWMVTVRDILHTEFASKVTLTQLAARAGVHPVHICREFSKHFHCTMGDYLRRLRVDYACQKLTQENLSLPEIADACGFSDQSHFSTIFKRLTGHTPAKYRASTRLEKASTAVSTGG